MSNQIQRHLRVAQLYDEILNLITEDTFDEVGGRGHVQGKLNAVFNAGKVEGRLSAFTDGRIFGGITPEQDGLIGDWQRIVDGA